MNYDIIYYVNGIIPSTFLTITRGIEMNKIYALLSLAVLMLGCTGVTYAKGCPDGSEPIKSVASGGDYYVYKCGGASATNSKAGSVTLAMKPDTGDWLDEPIFPFTLKEKLRQKYEYSHITGFAMADFNNDGVDDILIVGVHNYHNRSDMVDSSSSETANIKCIVAAGCHDATRSVNIFSMKVHENQQYDEWDDPIKQVLATNVSDLMVKNYPIEMSAKSPMDIMTADFNGDGVIDVFIPDTGYQNTRGFPGHNDQYFLSQTDGTWLESTSTHVTGSGVRKGRGLQNFSHDGSVGDIDNDGDMDIVVTSIKWVGNGGQLLCYINQGDGHMVVRTCGAQFGWAVELGDMDNDGDLDIAFGGSSRQGHREWGQTNLLPRNGAFNGVLLNDGTGNFYQRGASFSEFKSSYGFTYAGVPTVSIADLDNDGDLDVIRMHVGHLYAGTMLSIEENLGNGQFKTAYLEEWCKGPKTKADWPQGSEGSNHNCVTSSFMLGDFNEDGFVDFVVTGKLRESFTTSRGDNYPDGTVYLSTGKFTYDVIRRPRDKDYPLNDFEVQGLSYYD